MSLLLKALNKAEGEEGREPVASSASVDFDTIGAGATADKAEVSHRVAAVVAVLKKKDSRSFRLHEFLAPVKAKKKQEGFFSNPLLAWLF